MDEVSPNENGDKRNERGQFMPGNSASPGRPKGARNKLGELLLEALVADFETEGAAAIVKVRTERPQDYLKVIASLLPRELKIERADELSDAEVDQRLRQLAELIGTEIGISFAAGGKAASAQKKSARGIPTIQ